MTPSPRRRVLRPGALPAILVHEPFFPGQVVDLNLSWDWERAAVDAARGAEGLIALVPEGTGAEHTWVLADAGELVATAAQVVGRSLNGLAVRAEALMRIRVTRLDLPPELPCVDGEPIEEAANRDLDHLRDQVRSLMQLRLSEELRPEPLSFWTADADQFSDLVAPLIFEAGSDRARLAFEAPLSVRLELELETLLDRQAAQLAATRAAVAEPAAAVAGQLGKREDAVAAVFAKYGSARITPELRRALEERIRACATDADTSRRDLHHLGRLPIGRYAHPVASASRVRKALVREMGALDAMGQWVVDRVPILARAADGRPSTGMGRPLLLVGPPGVGKTRRAEAMAKCLGLPHYTIAGGGLSDALSIRGVRSLFTGSKPGIIVGALMETGVMNPVVIIDEVDKLGRGGHHGDPADALLAVLEPQQARAFRDDFIDVDLDLSGVVFVLTANDLNAVPRTLRDRCQVMTVAPYTAAQRRHILVRVVLPELLREHGVDRRGFTIGPAAIDALLERHVRDEGLRGLLNDLRTIVIRGQQRRGAGGSFRLAATDIDELLGVAPQDDVDRCVICGADILEAGEHLRVAASELPVSGYDASVPVAVHPDCVHRPTSYFLVHAHDIRARIAADVVVWNWILPPPDRPEAGGDPVQSPRR